MLFCGDLPKIVSIAHDPISPCESREHQYQYSFAKILRTIWDAEVVNQNDEPVAKYDVLTLVAKE
ncbi:Aldehyde dehydrogenase, PaaZ [Brevibacterium aurantiacum]|uniref:Aldehyde dehydrogenase, PaaZ n=1 Tax=Brevibacterium aurantiacum TaxID=273384 RepID=A0A1D7VZG1_BREAU|nr:Aldehyde dehydrogenase, PaaZ [Brevibacterium aurantiacum]